MTRKNRRTRIPDAGGWLPSAAAGRHWRPWLEEAGSLTARIVAACPPAAPFAVRVLKQGDGRPHGDERPLIGVAAQRLARCRDVLLLSGTTPVVYAHTVAPRDALRIAWHLMERVGSRALGGVLFADPRVSRGALGFRRLDRRHPLYRKAVAWCSADAAELTETLNKSVRAEPFVAAQESLVEAQAAPAPGFDRLSPNGKVLDQRLPKVLWARRAVFRLGGQPLLVTEVFLPSILALRA